MDINEKRKQINKVIWGLRCGGIQPSEAYERLTELGVLISTDNGEDLTGCCIARIEPLLEERDAEGRSEANADIVGR